MRCKACNKKLGSHSIKYNKELQDFEVCGECLHIVREIMETHRTQDRLKEMGIDYVDCLGEEDDERIEFS